MDGNSEHNGHAAIGRLADSLSARDFARNVVVEVTVTGVRRLRLRLWVAGLVFRIGAWVAGTRLDLRHIRDDG